MVLSVNRDAEPAAEIVFILHPAVLTCPRLLARRPVEAEKHVTVRQHLTIGQYLTIRQFHTCDGAAVATDYRLPGTR